MENLTITKHATEDAGEYRAHIPGSPHKGRLTWVAHEKDGKTIRIAEHTLVPPELAGRGIAAKLVEALIQDARAQGFRIIPQCSYVEAAFARHPDWADVRA